MSNSSSRIGANASPCCIMAWQIVSSAAASCCSQRGSFSFSVLCTVERSMYVGARVFVSTVQYKNGVRAARSSILCQTVQAFVRSRKDSPEPHTPEYHQCEQHLIQGPASLGYAFAVHGDYLCVLCFPVARPLPTTTTSVGVGSVYNERSTCTVRIHVRKRVLYLIRSLLRRERQPFEFTTKLVARTIKQDNRTLDPRMYANGNR